MFFKFLHCKYQRVFTQLGNSVGLALLATYHLCCRPGTTPLERGGLTIGQGLRTGADWLIWRHEGGDRWTS
jgi:hypothetical protein